MNFPTPYEINKRIRELCPDIIINNATGGGPGMPDDWRIQSVYANPEMCSLNMYSHLEEHASAIIFNL